MGEAESKASKGRTKAKGLRLSLPVRLSAGAWKRQAGPRARSRAMAVALARGLRTDKLAKGSLAIAFNL
jgi:hypothetical protein